MGVDTKIHIPLVEYDLNKTIKAVAKMIETKLPIFGVVEIANTKHPAQYDKTSAETRERSRVDMYEMHYIDFALDYPCSSYESGKEQRSLRTYYDHYEQGSMLYLSIGAWGHNEDIARCLVDNFGGYADFADCDDILIDYAMAQPKALKPA
jgi:hypothetical protein